MSNYIIYLINIGLGYPIDRLPERNSSTGNQGEGVYKDTEHGSR